jgi:hypothetical protein
VKLISLLYLLANQPISTAFAVNCLPRISLCSTEPLLPSSWIVTCREFTCSSSQHGKSLNLFEFFLKRAFLAVIYGTAQGIKTLIVYQILNQPVAALCQVQTLGFGDEVSIRRLLPKMGKLTISASPVTLRFVFMPTVLCCSGVVVFVTLVFGEAHPVLESAVNTLR